MLGVPLAAAIHFTVQLQDQTELSVVGVSGTRPTWIFSTTPSAHLTAAWGRWALGLQYALSLNGRSLESSPSVDMLQRGGLGLLWRTRRFQVALDEQASHGTVNYLTLAASTPGATQPPLQSLSMSTTLLTVSSRSTLTLSASLTRRLEGAVYGGWSLSGGADEDARQILPFQSGPIGGARTSYALSRSAWLDGTLDFTRVDFSKVPCTSASTTVGQTPSEPEPVTYCTPRTDQVTIQIGLRHRLTRTTDATVRAGAAAVGAQPSEATAYSLHADPVVGATLTHRSRAANAETAFRFSSQLSPIVSQQTGAVDRRWQGDASIDWASQRFLLHGQVRASQSIPFDVAGAYFLASQEASVGVRFDRHVTVSIGERLDWLRYASGQSSVAWVGLVRVQVTSRRIAF